MKMVLRLTLFIMLFLHAALYGQTTPTSTAGFTIGTNRAGITLAQAMDAAGDSVAVERAARIAQDAIHSAAILALDTSGTVAYADTARRAFTSARNDSIKVDSLNTKIRLDSLCLVNLNFARATYSNGVWTIPNDANKAAPAYMYGGLGWNVPGSDSSGVSRDIHTGEVVMALDGSAGDSFKIALSVDSTVTKWEFNCWWKEPNLTGTNYIMSLRWDTTGAGIANYSVLLQQRADTLRITRYTAAGVASSRTTAGFFTTLRRWRNYSIVRDGGNLIVRVNTDSVLSGSAFIGNIRPITKMFFGGIGYDALYNSAGKWRDVRFISGRFFTSPERLTLYNNSLRGIQPPGPSMGDVVQEAQKAAGDSARADTVGLTAGSNITITGTAPHRYTIASTASGGGGGGLPYDTTLYKRVLGWPSDSAIYGRFSGWRMLDNRTARADSATGDSLWSSIDQLKTTGGRILLLGSDTVHVYRLTDHDSLPTSGGISRTVTVQGTPKTVIQLKDGSAAPFTFTVNRPAGTGTAFLEFRDLRMITANNTGMMYVYRGRLRFENCDIDGGLPYITPLDGNAGDSLVVFNACRFGEVYSYISDRVGYILMSNCSGNIYNGRWNYSGITQSASRYGLHIINPHDLGFGGILSSGGSFEMWITGGSIRQTGGAELFEFCNVHASGVQVYFNPAASAAHTFIGTTSTGWNSNASFEGCSFWGGGVAGAGLRVTGCYFYNSPNAMYFSYGGSLNSCTVQNATTAVSANSYTKIHGLLHSGCSALISGTPAALADTMTIY